MIEYMIKSREQGMEGMEGMEGKAMMTRRDDCPISVHDDAHHHQENGRRRVSESSGRKNWIIIMTTRMNYTHMSDLNQEQQYNSMMR